MERCILFLALTGLATAFLPEVPDLVPEVLPPLPGWEQNDWSVPPTFVDQLLNSGNLKLFQEIAGVDHYNITPPSFFDPNFIILNKELYQGDILLAKDQVEMGRQGLSSQSRRWPNRKMAYWIDKNYPASSKAKVEQAIRRWNQILGSCLQLTPWKQGDTAYVHVFNGQGCYSMLGRQGGPQMLSLDVRGCTQQGTVLHEFMHAAGLVHEQNRPDRDSAIDMHWQNIKRDWQSQFKKEDSTTVGTYGPYNCYSLMHYPRRHPQFSVNNQPAFTVRRAGACDDSRIGATQDFTQGDLNAIRKMYKC